VLDESEAPYISNPSNKMMVILIPRTIIKYLFVNQKMKIITIVFEVVIEKSSSTEEEL
jgi:hypothetical protein